LHFTAFDIKFDSLSFESNPYTIQLIFFPVQITTTIYFYRFLQLGCSNLPGKPTDPILSVTTRKFIRNPYEMKTFFAFLLLASVALQAHSAPFVIPITVSGKQTGNKIHISWSITENELAEVFELEKSLDGKSFSSCAIIFATSKNGVEEYSINEKFNNQNFIVYRIKLIYKSGVLFHSNALVFTVKEEKEHKKLQLMGNPVTSYVMLSYESKEIMPSSYNLYSATGKYILSKKIESAKGDNLIRIPVDQLQDNNYFIVEVLLQDGNRETVKFLKR